MEFLLSKRASRVMGWSTLALVVIYAIYYWRYCHIFDGDHGRWMYEAWLFSQGKTPYRDIPYQYPPLSLYLYGFITRLFHGDIVSNFVTSGAIYGALCFAVWAWFRRHFPRELLALACLAAFFCATYRMTTWGSAPLSTGSYATAQPLGALFLLCACLWREKLFACGVCVALAVLSKQDFWVPAAAVTFLSGVDFSSLRISLKKNIATGLPCVATLAAGLAACGVDCGFENIGDMFSGYGQMGSSHLRPSLSLFFKNVSFAALSTMILVGAAFFSEKENGKIRRVFWISVLAFVVSFVIYSAASNMEWYTEWRGFQATAVGKRKLFAIPFVRWLWDWASNYIVSIVFAAGVLAVVLWKKTNQLGFLAILALAVRSRHGFDTYGWYYAFFDLPLLYGLFAAFLEKREIVYLSVAKVFVGYGAIFLCLGMMSHRFTGIVKVDTPHGWVRMPKEMAQSYESLKQAMGAVDPSGKRGLVPLRSASLNYFLDRSNPIGLTQGFLSHRPVEEVIREIVDKKPILLLSPGQAMRVPDHYREQHSVAELLEGHGPYTVLLRNYLPATGLELSGPWVFLLPREEVLSRLVSNR